MSGPALDGRRETALHAELLRRAGAMLASDGQDRPAGEIAAAILGVAARIGEEVSRRLDRVPDKQTGNLLNALGIGRDPARPAQVPVAFRLAEPAPEAVIAPAATQLMASGEAGPVLFETGRAIVLAPGSIAALVGIDAAGDRIFQPPDGVVDAALPREPAVERRLASGAAAGADRVQISLTTGVETGTILAFETPAAASQHRVSKVDGDLVTVDPPLDRTLEAGTPVVLVTDFAPFSGHRDRQSHAFYLGHSTLLNVPSPLGITVTGLSLPDSAEWSWWGQVGEDPPGWHALAAVADRGRLTLTKKAGQPVKLAIRGRETLWLRAKLPGASAGAAAARDIRLSMAGEGVCRRDRLERCEVTGEPMSVAFEAIANTTPVVLNAPFHPFGREPRLYDSFYVGCAEAFSKPGAEVSLCFTFAGPNLGPLAMVEKDGRAQIFGVGEDGLLYRGQFGGEQARLMSIALLGDKTGGTPLPPRSRVAARLVDERVLVAIAGQGSVYFAELPFEEPLDAPAIEWKSLISAEDSNVRFEQIAIVVEDGKPVVLAQADNRVLCWTAPADLAPAGVIPESRLVPLQGADAALVIGPVAAVGDSVVTVRGSEKAVSKKLTDGPLPAMGLAAWGISPAQHKLEQTDARQQAETDLLKLNAAVEAAGSELQQAEDALDPTGSEPEPKAVHDAKMKLDQATAARRQALKNLARLKEAETGDAGPSAWTLFLAGYDRADKLRVVHIDISTGAVAQKDTLEGDELPERAQGAAQGWPIALQPPPREPSSAGGAADVPPTILLAAATPARFVWQGESYKKAAAARSIGISGNPHRQFVTSPGWIAVHRGHLGLLYRPAGGSGDWADELLITQSEALEVAEGVPEIDGLYAAPDHSPKGDGYEILRSRIAGRAVLRPSPGPRKRSPTASFFVPGSEPKGSLQIEEDRVRLVDDEAFANWGRAVAKLNELEEIVRQAQRSVNARTAERQAKAGQAGEAEAVYRTAEQGLADARKQAESARAKASDLQDKLRQATEARQQAETGLIELKAAAEAAIAAQGKAQRAADARRQAEADLGELNAKEAAAAEKLQQAKDARQQVETRLAELDGRVADAADKLRRATEDLQRQQAPLARLNAAVEAAAGKLPQAKDARAQAEADLPGLTARVDAAADRLRQATQDLQRQQAPLTELNAAVEAAAARLQQAKDARQQAEAPLPELTARVDAAADRLRQATQDLQRQQAPVAELSAAVDAAAARLQQAKDARQHAETVLPELTARVDAAADELRQATENLQRQEAPLTGLNAAVAAAAARLQQAKDARQQAQAALAEPNARVDAAAGALQQAKAARQQAEADLARLTAEAKAADDDAKGRAAVTPKMIATAEARVAAARTEEEKARDKASAAEEEKRQRAEAQDAATIRHETAKSSWQGLVGAAEGLAGQVRQASADLSARESERDNAKRTAASLASYSVRVDGPEVDIAVFGEGQDPDPRQIWHLKRSGQDPQWWNRPSGFPQAGPAPEVQSLGYRILRRVQDIAVEEAVGIRDPERIEDRIRQLGAENPLRFDSRPNMTIPPIERFTRPGATEVGTIAVPAELFKDGRALLTAATGDWRSLGPSQPPNPALSWEYWNGRSWWALDGAGLVDRTANLLVDNGVFFIVPADLEESEVGGRKNHWIRARLVGGDYGEAQVTVKSAEVDGETRQTVERDMTTIRAPYVTSLQLGFCARTEVAPEVVLTEDSLGAVDQTSANLAGLPIAVFAPLADLLTGEPAAGGTIGRGLMIGFERPVRGDPVALHVDAAPTGAAVELIAEVLRDGRFQPVAIRDGTHGLSERGTIRLALNAPPDLTDLFGTPAHWLRLRPRGEVAGWSPRIRGLWLNAVDAHSIETRTMESLGQSSGIAAQRFQLTVAPVAPGSLELRVRERLGEDLLRAGALDVADSAGTMPGPWVRWAEVPDLGEVEGPARAFMLNAETGLVRFGDGRHGAIPPAGAELLAIAYHHVAGAAGNDVAAGAALQLVSPLGGVERVTALDAAAGGSDVESAESARRRGSAKLRHGERILTLADLEDHVRGRSPTIAQARAANRDGGVRLVVAVTGADPRPAPAMLRALEQSVRSAAGFGIARPQGLSIVPPRLLALRIEALLGPDEPDRFVEMSQAAAAGLAALLDPASGGFDGRGWPIGRLPTPVEVSAALEPVCRLGTISGIAVERAGGGPDRPLGPAIPADMLVRLDPNDFIARRQEAAS